MDDQPDVQMPSAVDQLNARARREREAAVDFAGQMEELRKVEAARSDPANQWTVHGEVGRAAWGAVADIAYEGFIAAKDMAHAVAPVDTLLWKLQTGKSWTEAEADVRASQGNYNDVLRATRDVIAPENETLGGNIGRSAVTFMVPYLRLAKAVGGIETFAQATAAGALIDYSMFDPNEGNLSTLINTYGDGKYKTQITEFLATDPDDDEALNRLRNALEGGVLGAAVEGVLKVARIAVARRKVAKAHEEADKSGLYLDELDRLAAERAAAEAPAVTPEVEVDPVTRAFDNIAEDTSVQQIDPNMRYWAATLEDGTELGSMEAVITTDGHLQVKNTGVNDPSHRGKGFGSKLYDQVIERARAEGRTLVSDQSVSADAMKMYYAMEQRGAVIDNQIISNRNNVIRAEVPDPRRRPDGTWDTEGKRVQYQTKDGTPLITVKKLPEQRAPKEAAVEAPKAPEPPTLEVRRKNLETNLRDTLRMTEEQKLAFQKKLEESDDAALKELALHDFNANTYDWDAVDDPHLIRKIINTTSEVLAEHINTVKGGVQTNVQTKRLANLVGGTAEEVHHLFADVRGDKGISARFLAATRVMLSSARRLKELAAAAKASGSHEDKAAFFRHLQLHGALQAEVKGAQTEIARALQAMSILKEDSLAGFREFDEIVRSYGDSPRDIERVMDDILDARSIDELNARSRQSTGQRVRNIIVEYVINAMLSSVKTHVINFTSNTLNTFLYSADKFLAGSYRYVRAGDKALLREARIDLYTKLTTLDQAWTLAKQAWKDGAPVTDKRQRIEFSTRKGTAAEGTVRDLRPGEAFGSDLGSPIIARRTEYGTDKYGKQYAVDFNFTQRAINTLGNVIRIPGRALVTGDEFFKAINRNAEIAALSFRAAHDEAIQKGFKYGTRKYEAYVVKRTAELPTSDWPIGREIRSKAIEKSRLATFQESARTDFGKTAEKWINSNVFVKLVIAPFFRTPMNILRQGVFDRTPLGFTLSRTRETILKGDPRDAAEAVARMTTGVAAMASFYSMIATDEDESGVRVVGRQAFDSSARAAGVLDYSIKIGDTWYQFNRLDPVGMWLGMVADMKTHARIHDPNDPNSESRVFALAQGAMGGFLNNVLNKTWMKSLSELQEMLTGVSDGKPETVERAVEKFLASETAKLIPALVKATGRGAQALIDGEDPTAREAWEYLDAVANQVPFLNKNLPPRHDVLGRPITYKNAVTATFNPFASSPDSPDPVDQEFMRLGFDIQPMPRSLGNGLLPLTAAEYSRLTGYVGSQPMGGQDNLTAALRDLITSERYASFSEERRIFEVKTRIEQARNAARLRLMAEPDMMERFKAAKIRDLSALLSPAQ